MQNLLRDSLAVADLERILPKSRPSIFPSAGEPQWEKVAAKPAVQEWLRQIRKRAAGERDEPMPVLTDELYEDFHKTGRGLPFSNPYFERRRRLARAAVCTLFDESAGAGRQRDPRASEWWPSFTTKLDDVLNEVAWAIPAHVKTPTGKDSWAIDIFAAETANLMAEAVTLFERWLPEETRHQIARRLRVQYFENYLNRSEHFRWIRGTSNWNAVCHHGILGAALAVEPDHRLLARILHHSRQYLPFFLTGFTADGGCSEGPGYWEYGFGSFSILNEQLERATGGALSLLEGDDLARAIARYGSRMSLIEGRLVNFADCRPKGALRPFLFQMLGERLNEEECLEQARINYAEIFKHPLNIDAQRCDISFLLRLFRGCPDDVENPPLPRSRTFTFPEREVLVHKGAAGNGRWVEFAAKGGHNAEHHNHNDCGSFLLHVDGRPLIREIGGSEYTRAYLRERRYEFIATRTAGHSLPLINGCEQAAGREFRAEPRESSISPERISWHMDLTRAYPAEATCHSCERTFTYHPEKAELVVKDVFLLEVADQIETALITAADVEKTPTGARITDGESQLELICGENTLLDRVEKHDYRTGQGDPAFVRRLVLIAKDLQPQAPVTVGYTLRIAGPA